MPLGPFFKSMPNRFGTPLGAALERTTLDAVGGDGGIRSRLHRNADGSTTLLKTRNGMAKFITTGGGGRRNDFTMTSVQFYGGSNVDHQFHHTPQNYQGTFKMWLVNLAEVPALRIGGLSGGFTIDGDTVTTPPGCLWYPEYVILESDGLPYPLPASGTPLYEIHIGPTRDSRPDVFGIGYMPY